MAESSQGGGPGPATSERRWGLYVVCAAALLALVFVLQNREETSVTFLFAETELPLFFALLIAMALGAVIGWLAPRVIRGARRD